MTPSIETGGVPPEEQGWQPPPELPPGSRKDLFDRKKQILAFGDIVEEDRKILEEPIFNRGDTVTVRRSSGEEDPGWQVLSASEGRVTVVKTVERYGREQVAKKTVSEEDLVELNP